jgi:hypothetical protein
MESEITFPMTYDPEYKFNPLDFGFKPVTEFPELAWCDGTSDDVFIKITADTEMKEFGRRVYWYSRCQKIGLSGDERWKFTASSHDAWGKKDYHHSHVEYAGCITSHNFARILLSHIFGTTQNKGVFEDGIKRMENGSIKKD